MTYTCKKCDMGVTNMQCKSCHQPLIHDHIDVEGEQVAVSKCPDGCGMIKSPQCCGQDMEYSDE